MAEEGKLPDWLSATPPEQKAKAPLPDWLSATPPVDFSSADKFPDKVQTRLNEGASLAKEGMPGTEDHYDPLAASAGVAPPGTPRIDQINWGQKSWLEQAAEQSQKDQEAFAKGGVHDMLKDTEATQELAGGFGGTPIHTPLIIPRGIGDFPLIHTKDGNLARVIPDETGAPRAKVIGPPPKGPDFEIATQAIRRQGAPSDRATTSIRQVDAFLNDPEVKAAMDRPVVNRKNDVPYAAGPNKTGNGLNIDKDFPRQMTVDNVTFDPTTPLGIHEFVERDVMDKLTKGGMTDEAAYRVAHHEYANKAEDAWYRTNNLDPEKVNAAYKPILDKINEKHAGHITEEEVNTRLKKDAIYQNSDTISGMKARENQIREKMMEEKGGIHPPPDLYDKPYDHRRPTGGGPSVEADKPTPAEIEQANKILGDMPTPRPPEHAIQQKLLDAWNTHGIHPYEAAEAAARSPVMARDLSSARTPSMPLPARPSRNFLQEVDDNFHRLKGAHTADQAEMLHMLDDLPNTVKDAETQRLWYHYGEGDPEVSLTPAEGRQYNDVMMPLKKEERMLWEEARKTELDVSEYDPNYMHRIVVGKAPQIDRLAGEGTEANPIYNGPGILARSTSSMHERKFMVLEDEAGNRKVMTTSEIAKFMDMHGSIADEVRVGETINAEQTYTVRQALTNEIEAATDTRYYKNALINTLDNVLKLRAVNRAIYAIQQLRDTPEWAAYTAPNHGPVRPGTEDWITPKMPMFKNDRMDPKLAHVIDDFYGRIPIDGLAATLEKINHFAVSSLFWTPVPHALNAGAWWATARAWNNITPSGMQSLVTNGARAIRQVVTQGEDYQRLLREGSSLVYGGIANRDFMQKMLQRAGMELPKDEKSWAAVAKAAGMSPVTLGNAMYNASSKALWAFSDVVMMQRVLELEGQGLATRAAIAEAERIIPNYRVPSEILGSRSLQQVWTNRFLFQFTPYHYTSLRGFANLAKSLAVGNAQQRTDAIGSIMVLGTLGLLVWPAISAGLNQVFGEKNIKAPSAGPGKLIEPVIGMGVRATPSAWPKFVQDYYKDDKSLMQQIYNMASLAPAAKLGMEAYNNRDAFSGRPIVEPADVRNQRFERVLGQMAEKGVGAMVQPYDTVREAYRTGKELPQVLLEHAFGLTNRTDAQEEAKMKAFHYQEKEAARRGRKAGPLEQLTR